MFWHLFFSFFFFLFSFFYNVLGTVNRRTEAEIRTESYTGKIIDIYQDKKNHYIYTFRVVSVDNDFTMSVASWGEAWTWASIGDSIVKQTDTLMITIKKTNGESKEFYKRRTKFALESDCITGFMVKILPK